MVCRLLTGGNSNPTYGSSSGQDGVQLGGNSEWNRLIYPTLTQVPSDLGLYSGGRQFVSNWADISISDFGDDWNDDGRGVWCQETLGQDTSRRVLRAYGGRVSYFYGFPAWSTYANDGFRPVLEIIP